PARVLVLHGELAGDPSAGIVRRPLRPGIPLEGVELARLDFRAHDRPVHFDLLCASSTLPGAAHGNAPPPAPSPPAGEGDAPARGRGKIVGMAVDELVVDMVHSAITATPGRSIDDVRFV